MKKILSMMVVGFAAFLFGLQPTSAATTLEAGDLIKASGPAVYYFSEDGSRLVFPNEKTFFTWFDNFDAVVEITDAELAALPIGGNVTYRPGVKLVKITTDPKTYAVAAGGVLRHLTSEAIASELYGADWNQKVDDVADTYFVNYNVGMPISDASDYNVTDAMTAATSIDADRATIVPEPPPEPPPTCETCNATTTPMVTLTVSKTTALPGDEIVLTATAQHASGISKIDLFLGDTLVGSCSATTCVQNTSIPLVAYADTYLARAHVVSVDATEADATASIVIQEYSVSGVTIAGYKSEMRSGQTITLTINTTGIHVRRIDLFLNGGSKFVCEDEKSYCTDTITPVGALGDELTMYAEVKDTEGRIYRSENYIITITENDSPSVMLDVGMGYVYPGGTQTVTVQASDDNGIQSIEVLDADKNVLKTCQGAAPCSVQVGPWTELSTHTFHGRAIDLLGAMGENMATITVKNP